MTDEPDGDLPLHDEAKARSKWREGETLIRDGGLEASGPASETDDAAQGRGGGDAVLKGAAQSPPD